MKCEICGADAAFHVTELQIDGTSVSRHLCEAHAGKAGIAIPSAEQQAMAMVAKLRSLASFIRSNNRMPTRDELRQKFNAAGDLSRTLPGTADFNRQLTYLEECADFIEKNLRVPTEEEMPDPF